MSTNTTITANNINISELPIVKTFSGWDSKIIVEDYLNTSSQVAIKTLDDFEIVAIPEELFIKQAQEIAPSLHTTGWASGLITQQAQAKIVKLICNKDFKSLSPTKQVEILKNCQMTEHDLRVVKEACTDLSSLMWDSSFGVDPKHRPEQLLTKEEIQELEKNGLNEITVEAIRKKSLILTTVHNVNTTIQHSTDVAQKQLRNLRKTTTNLYNNIPTFHRLTHPKEYVQLGSHWVHARDYYKMTDQERNRLCWESPNDPFEDDDNQTIL